MESFEEGIPSKLTAEGGTLSIDSRRMKHGDNSLRWDWEGNSKLTYSTAIGYRRQRRPSMLEAENFNMHASPEEDILEPPRGFFLWIYNDQARSQRLRIQFGHGEDIDCEFDYNLNFKGWRTVAINYDRGDMRGTPREDMDRMTILAPATGSGSLYLDVLGFSVPMNPRTVNSNPQLPEIDRHPRLVAQYPHLIYEFSNYTPSFPLLPLDEAVLKDFRTLDRQAKRFWLSEGKIGGWNDSEIANIRKDYARFSISRDGDNTYGRPLTKENIITEYFAEMGLPKNELMEGLMRWRHDFGKLLLEVAEAWHCTGSAMEKTELEEMFINLFDYGIDQGFDTGAGLGWIHHYSYVIREYAPAMYLMRDTLKRYDRLEKATEISKWFHGFNQVYREDLVYDSEGRISANADDMQGLLSQRLLCALMMEDSKEKARDLRHFSSYFSNVTSAYANALDETFKPDGTLFHHAGHTLSYGGRAIYGSVRTHFMLSNTSFQATDAATQRIEKVVDTLYACLFGEELAAPKAFASIRFKNFTLPNDCRDMRSLMGMEDEESDNFRMLPYSCVGIRRQKNDWMITVRGHSKYVYPFESWGKSFFAYPLYIANGYLDVTYPDDMDSLTPESGIWHPGYDWRRFPGTTTVRLPFADLATRVGQVRDEGGEYLLSDQAFSGGVESSSGSGIYVFPFKGHDKYHLESFTGKKSWFFSGDMVVCLGSNITSKLPDYPVETTLFQNYLNTTDEPILLEENAIATFPYDTSLDPNEPHWLIDNRETGYYLPPAPDGTSVNLVRANQVHPDANEKETASGNFTSLVMNHGKAPVDAAYQYVLVADAKPAHMKAFSEAMQGSRPPVQILQANDQAHVVAFREPATTAYAVFSPAGLSFPDGQVESVSKQVTLLLEEDGDSLRLSVADPDLNIYDGQDDLLPDGSRCELSIYEREWFYWPSRPTEVRVTLRGQWHIEDILKEMETTSTQARILYSNSEHTQIAVTCRDGLSTELYLTMR